MKSRLIIRLGSHATDCINWLQFDDSSQEIIASGTLNNASELTQLTTQANAATVQILVPGGDVSYFEVPVPKNNRRQALAAIPFMLEDELADEIDALHFVYTKGKGDVQGVYVCNKLKLQMWLQWLNEAHISTTVLLPDYLAVPISQDENIAVLALDNHLLIRTSQYHGLCASNNWLEFALTQLLREDQPLTIAHYAVPPASQIAPHVWQEQTVTLPMATLATELLKIPVNLLTGDFSQHKPQHNHWQLWRGLAIAASVLVVLFFTEKLLKIHALEAQQLVFKQQSEAIYRQLNPNVKRIVKLKRRMKNELSQLAEGRSNNDLSSMLAVMQQAFVAVPTVKPTSVKYDRRRQEIRMQAQAASYQQFEQFKRILANEYTVTMGAMNNNGNTVNGSLVIKVSS